MLENIAGYCERNIENKVDLKNKTTAYEYLIKRFFESYFEKKKDYKLNLFPIIEDLTPDMELSNGHEIIIFEIKFFEDSSSNRKTASVLYLK